MLGIDTVLGLPVHVLIVHFAVVLVPLGALALLAAGWKQEWRKRYLLPIALVAIVGAGAAMVAAQSGEALQSSLSRTAEASGYQLSSNAGGESDNALGDHPEQGNMAEIVSILLAGAVTGFFVLETWGHQYIEVTATHTRGAYALCSVLAVLAIAAMIAAGHSGATLVWKDLGNFVPPR
jgi:hypothetical protein